MITPAKPRNARAYPTWGALNGTPCQVNRRSANNAKPDMKKANVKAKAVNCRKSLDTAGSRKTLHVRVKLISSVCSCCVSGETGDLPGSSSEVARMLVAERHAAR